MNQNNSMPQKFDSNTVLFVSDLPKDADEEDLSTFFKNYHYTQAKVNKSKSSTFAYVYFENPDYANKARKDLNGEILVSKYSGTGRPVRICKYEMKNQMENIKDPSKSLLVKNLDKDITAKEFYKMFEQFGEVRSSKLEVDEKGVSRNYGYILFSDTKSAVLAKEKLNGKEIKGRILEVVNLIPSKSKDNSHNNIYVKNFPRDFTDEDLLKLFSKYGEISSAIVSKDDKGVSKGFGFVCFALPINAMQSMKDLKERSLSFPGLPPLYVNFAMKKEERHHYSKESGIGVDNPKFIATYLDDTDIRSVEDFDRELRLFIKIILLQEYSPKRIEINFEIKTAIVTMNSSRDIEEFFKKYTENSMYNYPKFMIRPYIEQPILPMHIHPMMAKGMPMSDPNMLLNHFSNMTLNPPGMPIIYVDPNKPMMMNMNQNRNFMQTNFNVPYGKKFHQHLNPPNRHFNHKPIPLHNPQYHQQTVEDPTLIEDTAAEIYEVVENMYPDDAGKITGMIVDFGLDEMKILLKSREKLHQVIDEAYEMLHK